MGDSVFSPRVGCGAAVLHEGKLLLVKRCRPPEAGHWGLPGGKVDWLEPVSAAVAREISEELGIVIRPQQLLCIVDQIDIHGNEHWVAPVYLVEDFIGEPELREPKALSEFGWFHLDQMPAPLTRATEVTIAVLKESRTELYSGCSS
ncbi:NUDIX domain-containing protein [Microvirga sp. 17 mud 1-3]|uniref:NUDIX domain-containing protein n=1 Tax=Microvirga sp. 17 mud 1-3 TaxID=2082949 RepID=UPI000D6B2943|nr:NUDIX domain-containing protein [Microvirga sp. 17 mud 1-3]AWM85530.1 ADP-ribose pyrophosphatase [Microvirga sp. 17 mud 1-3]